MCERTFTVLVLLVRAIFSHNSHGFIRIPQSNRCQSVYDYCKMFQNATTFEYRYWNYLIYRSLLRFLNTKLSGFSGSVKLQKSVFPNLHLCLWIKTFLLVCWHGMCRCKWIILSSIKWKLQVKSVFHLRVYYVYR